MKKLFVSLFALAFVLVSAQAFSADLELAKKSTLESIVKAGEIRVGFESGYLPFEMTNTKGITSASTSTWENTWPRPWGSNTRR
jgi:polar amino acid transport system substrate-binding protein